MIRVREETPAVGRREQVVGRSGVAENLVVGVESVPPHGREDGVLAQFADIDLDSLPCRDTASALGVDHRCEVVAPGVASGHVARDAFPNREERREAEFGHALDITLRIPTDVLVHELADRPWHGLHSRRCVTVWSRN